ncbi:hypothetical protein FJZ31_15955 [Candidatus Poribacteria bacterium]|nr:hypothetical protein [Candidatus Poribacteria bacterium]
MSALVDEKQSRREFLRGSVRYLTLGGLVFATGALFTRRKVSSTKKKCDNPGLPAATIAAQAGICRSCPSFKNCGLAND